MAESATISINAHNIVTITVMWVLGLAVLGIVAMGYGKLAGKSGS